MPAEPDLTSRRRLSAAGLVGCGLIFCSTLATGALWRAAVPLDGGTVRSGSVVLLTGDATSQVRTYAFGALSATGLRPGSSVQAPLVVRNGGRSPLAYGLAGTASSGSALLAGQLSLRLDAVDGTCPTGVGVAAPVGVTATPYAGPAVGASSTASRRLVPGATETLCVRVTVRSDAPTTASGATTTITLTFGAQTP